MVKKTMAKKTMAESNVAVIEQLNGIRTLVSKLMKDQQLQKLKFPVSRATAAKTLAIYGGPSRPYVCRAIYSSDDLARNDFADALREIHQWMGYVVKVLELNCKIIRPAR